MSGLDPNAIIRGAQLTIVGAYRALQNPRLFNNALYRQAAMAVAAGFAIRLVISIPGLIVRILLFFVGFVVDLGSTQWGNKTLSGLHFIENSVLQLPLFLMSAMRFISPAMDEMFMKSLEWVDHTYMVKHKSDDPMTLRALYYPNIAMYRSQAPTPELKGRRSKHHAALVFLKRHAQRAVISLGIYMLTFVPYIGRFVLPAASFYSLNKAIGIEAAAVVFGVGFILPRRWMVMFFARILCQSEFDAGAA